MISGQFVSFQSWNRFLRIDLTMQDYLYFLSPRFWSSPVLIVLFTASIFFVVLFRYLIFASVYQAAIRRLFARTINRPTIQINQRKKEILWSALSSLIFAILTVVCFLLYDKGYTRIYTSLDDHSVFYFIFTIVIMLVLYETYYYWLHRWMHRPSVYRIVHKVHHDSIHTSAFTSFSFHPVEAILQFLFLPVMIFIMPVHYYAVGIVLMLMTVSAIVNHAGVEIFPRKFNKHRIGRWFIGATHHDLHHKEFRSNFGLYFTFWDKWMKTESRNFDAAFKQNAPQKEQHVSQSR
jgi:Delta7-sterol 5-desaturase